MCSYPLDYCVVKLIVCCGFIIHAHLLSLPMQELTLDDVKGMVSNEKQRK